MPAVVLSTASPYKFCSSVLEALGLPLTGSDKTDMEACYEYTKAPIPSGLSGIWERPVIHEDVINPQDMKAYVIEKAIEKM